MYVAHEFGLRRLLGSGVTQSEPFAAPMAQSLRIIIIVGGIWPITLPGGRVLNVPSGDEMVTQVSRSDLSARSRFPLIDSDSEAGNDQTLSVHRPILPLRGVLGMG